MLLYVYYYQWEAALYRLEISGDKGTQRRDIEKAKKFWDNYLRCQKKGE